MYRALLCLTNDHTAWAVPLAALVCWFSSLTTIYLLQKGRSEEANGPFIWIAGAGVTAGIGIWSTHFIAMLGYDPGYGIGYDLRLTFFSLVVGAVSACCALMLTRYARGPVAAVAAGVLLGAGIAAMHFTGMAGIRLPGTLSWHGPLVVAALGSGCGLAGVALLLATRPGGRLVQVPAATLLTAAIACLHFLAMAAIEITPDPSLAPEVEGFPRGVLAIGIAVGMLTVLAISALALFAEHLSRTNRTLLEGKRLLREKSDLLDTILEAMDQGLMMVDAAGRVQVRNERAAALLGLSEAAARERWAGEALSRRGAAPFEHAGPDGTVFEMRTVPMPGGGAVLTCTDITLRKRAETRIAESEARLALALDAGSDGLWDCDLATGEAWCSERWWRVLGYEPGEMEAHARTWQMLVHPEDAPLTERVLADHLEGRAATYEAEHRMRRKDGTWAWLLTRGRVVARAADGAPLRFVGTQLDIGARKAAEGQIAHMARHDGLTDLPNRALFYDRLEERLSERRARGAAAAVLCLDLDRFKAVNDRLGHLAGDTVLRVVAHRIRVMLRAEDTVARLGGDEFAVLVDDVGEVGALEALAESLIAAVRAPILIGPQSVDVGLSIGIALVSEAGLAGEEVFKRADLALYRAKAEGRNTHRIFAAAMDAAAAERRALECELRRAIENDELTLHYQPQVTTGGHHLVGFEALVRWQHPERGLVPPSTFVPLAEETGLIMALGEWVLRSACREAASWSRPLKIAVNLSPLQFQQAELPERVLAILTEAGLSPTRLELEITETVIINDMARALNILRRLKGLGISIAMDDFGTGYSSLATLQAFPFDKIKIDRAFVGHVEGSPQAAVIVRAVLGLGRSLGMGVVAEGVETQDQMRFLTDESCDEVQGYLVGKPQPIERFAHYVRGADARAVWSEEGAPVAA